MRHFCRKDARQLRLQPTTLLPPRLLSPPALKKCHSSHHSLHPVVFALVLVLASVVRTALKRVIMEAKVKKAIKDIEAPNAAAALKATPSRQCTRHHTD